MRRQILPNIPTEKEYQALQMPKKRVMHLRVGTRKLALQRK